MSDGSIETQGTDDDAERIGQAPTTTDVTDPDRSSRGTAAGSGSEPGQGPVQPASDIEVDPGQHRAPRRGPRLSRLNGAGPDAPGPAGTSGNRSAKAMGLARRAG